MKYPYLADRTKAKNLSLALICVSCLLLVVNLFVNNSIVQCIGCILAIVFYAFAMHYLDFHNVQGQSIKKYIFTIHTFALHALLFIFEGFARAPGNLSYQVLHGLVDAYLMAMIIALIKLNKSKISYAMVCICGLLSFVLALFNVNIVLNLLLLAAGIALAYFAYDKNKASAFLGIVVAVIALYALISKNTPKVHDILHPIAIICTMLIAYLLYEVVKERPFEESISRASINLEPTVKKTETETVKVDVETEKTQKKTLTRNTAKKEKTAVRTRKKGKYTFDKSWFIKEYQSLSYEDLLNAPVYAFKGVSEAMAKDLTDAFGIKTIGDLADSKYFAWAKEIVEEAD